MRARTVLDWLTVLYVVHRRAPARRCSVYIFVDWLNEYSKCPSRSVLLLPFTSEETRLRMVKLLAQWHQDLPLGSDPAKIRTLLQLQGSYLLLQGPPKEKLQVNFCIGSKRQRRAPWPPVTLDILLNMSWTLSLLPLCSCLFHMESLYPLSILCKS